MKISYLQIALVMCAVGSAAPSFGQYAPPTSGGYRPPVYAPYAQPTMGRGVPQFMASRPMPTQVAPAVPSFRPVNPPSQATQRIMVASRTPNTASQGRAPAKVASAQTYQPSGGWVAPTASMGTSYGTAGYGAPGGYAQTGGYGAGQAPVAQGDSGPMPSGDCGGESGGCAPACGGGCGLCGCIGGCFRGCFHQCCCCLSGHTCCTPLKGTGDLVQHMPFFGTTHGYYYFRPYHVMHVFSQQELATRWGGDARNPYDNSMFERVYQQMGVDARSAQPTLGTVPSSVAPMMVPTYPTPVPAYQPAPAYQPMPQMAPATVIPSQPSTEYVPTPVR